MIYKIGFGGSCHWCTEAIFQSLNGVVDVRQGWLSSEEKASSFSEGVIVSYNDLIISLQTLIAIHLHTHSCTSNHSMRSKYRSAVYTFSPIQAMVAEDTIKVLQAAFDDPIITEVVTFHEFRLNQESYLNYYYSNPEKPFCENVVSPKLKLLLRSFSDYVDKDKLF